MCLRGHMKLTLLRQPALPLRLRGHTKGMSMGYRHEAPSINYRWAAFIATLILPRVIWLSFMLSCVIAILAQWGALSLCQLRKLLPAGSHPVPECVLLLPSHRWLSLSKRKTTWNCIHMRKAAGWRAHLVKRHCLEQCLLTLFVNGVTSQHISGEVGKHIPDALYSFLFTGLPVWWDDDDDDELHCLVCHVGIALSK